ncbi:thioesterase II family protein [Streptomyces sp. NPDC059679]|uniref:thioesterase II family protein n=1 Tax=Streptomyces sp. NPDC059679 TaxID=3346903 RepID=UPI0036B31155
MDANCPPEPWTIFAGFEPSARLRLLCFPFAGGGASTYRAWGADLAGSGVEVWPVQLPGRENRRREPPVDDLGVLVQQLADAFGPCLGRTPYALFGHSLGALIAYEFARELRRRGLPEPVRLIASAHRAPSRPDLGAPMHDMPHAQFIERLREVGALPEQMLREPDLLDLLVPKFRADFALSERYRWEPGKALDCPLTVLGGRADTLPEHELWAWETMTTGPFQVTLLQGDHFYLLNESRRPTIETVDALLSPVDADD